jgi:hypothetical protein
METLDETSRNSPDGAEPPLYSLKACGTSSGWRELATSPEVTGDIDFSGADVRD